MNGVDPDPLLRVSEAAELLSVTEKTVRRYIAEDKLRASKLAGGTVWRVRRSDVLALLQPRSGDHDAD